MLQGEVWSVHFDTLESIAGRFLHRSLKVVAPSAERLLFVDQVSESRPRT